MTDTYRYIDNSGRRPTEVAIMPDGWRDGRGCISLDGDDVAFLPAYERQAAAQALAGDEYGVVPAAEAAAPDGALSLIADVIGTDDLGEVLPAVEGLKEREKEAYHLKRANDALCRQNEQLRAEVTALREREAQPDRPEPVDPASVRVGDYVSIEPLYNEDGLPSWRIDGSVTIIYPDGLITIPVFGSAVGIDPAQTTVRVLHGAEPVPDEAAVEALAKALHATGRDGTDWGKLTDSGGWYERARILIRDHGVQVEVPDAD